MSFQSKIESIDKTISLLETKKQTLVSKALTGSNPLDILKAKETLDGIENKEKSNKKSFLFDPQSFQQSLGFKDKPTSLSYNLLRNMSRTSIINAIIKTRINQIASFAQPQTDKYGYGYQIRKKRISMEEPKEMSKIEMKQVDGIIRFLDETSSTTRWDNEDFESFIRKIVRDSLVFDQMTFEVVTDRKGIPHEFYAVDASTIRIAQFYEELDERGRLADENSIASTYKNLYNNPYNNINRQKVQGYFPSYVQIYNRLIVSEFYPWELCFGVRNPDSNILLNGYGVSELEELTTMITSLLWSEEYNSRFFKQGSSPKGILKVKNASMNPNRLQEFRQEWMATMRGVNNSWRTPIMDGDIDWIDLTKTNKDMEFSHWMEFLIKITCAVYTIDPAEVNFPLSGGSEQRSMFEGSNEARLKHSKDKGLAPILKFLQRKINRFIINRINPEFEFVFCGYDALTISEEMELDNKAIRSFSTVNEIRRKRGLQDIDGGDIILDGVYTNKLQMDSQNAMMSQQGENEEEQQPIEETSEENPFVKSFQDYFEKL